MFDQHMNNLPFNFLNHAQQCQSLGCDYCKTSTCDLMVCWHVPFTAVIDDIFTVVHVVVLRANM